jgi:hypothetical protein
MAGCATARPITSRHFATFPTNSRLAAKCNRFVRELRFCPRSCLCQLQSAATVSNELDRRPDSLTEFNGGLPADQIPGPSCVKKDPVDFSSLSGRTFNSARVTARFS